MTETPQPNRLRPAVLGVGGIVVLSTVLMGPAISLFFNTPVMAGTAGASVPLDFILAMIGILLTASTVAQYSRKLSSAGSFYGFLHRAAGPQVGFMGGWATFGAYLGLSVGGAAIAGAFISELVGRYAHFDLPWIYPALFIAAVVIGMSIAGIRLSQQVGLVMLSIEVVAIIVVVIAIFVQGGASGFTAKPFTFSGGLNGIRLAMDFGVLSFIGFEISATMAEETREPRRAVPRAVIGCTLALGALYVIGSYAVVIGFGTNHVKTLASNAAVFDTLTSRYVTGSAAIVVDLILINALVGATIAVTNSFARIAYALGRDGAIPQWFGHTHRRFHTPSNALMSYGACALVILIPLAIVGITGLHGYEYASTPAILLLILVFIAANLTVGRFYWREHRSEFRWPLHGLVPVIGSLVLLLPISAQFFPEPSFPSNILPLFTLGWIVLGGAILLREGKRILATVGAFGDEAVEHPTEVERPTTAGASG
ncbi:MAG: APC family permease [Solirubrobacteraceae bacterium]